VFGTNVGSKLLVTLGLVPPLHFLERFANERASRIKHPVALGATKALNVLSLNPNQLAGHGRSIRLPVSKTEQCPDGVTC